MAKKNAKSEAIIERRTMIGARMNFASSEAYKVLRTNLMFSFPDNDSCKVIGTTSSFKGEGKSMTSLNLAYTLAEANKRVLLIEGDMRLPTLANRLKLKPAPGLSNLLAGLKSINDAVQHFASGKEGSEPVVIDVVVAGTIPPNPSELISSNRMEALVTTLKKHYDYILIDLPPVTAVTDAIVASKVTDGLMVVVRNNVANRGALAETMRQLKLVNCKILGFVYTDATSGGSYYKKGYYKKDYYKKDYYKKD